MKSIKISFTEEFLKVLDELLSSCYNKITTREHYLSFLYNLENKMAHCDDEKHSEPWFNYDKERRKYKLLKIDNKRVWQMAILIKNLDDNNVISVSSYNKDKGICRSYSYSGYFNYLLSDIERTIVQEEIPEDLYIKIITDKTVPTDPYLTPQYDLLKSDRFRIDTTQALSWINDQLLFPDKKRIYLRLAMDLNDKKITVTRGEKSNRLFTNFNFMKREFREMCYINDKPLSSLDLKTSQPYLFASYMVEKYKSYEAKRFYELVTDDDIYTWFLNKWNETEDHFYWHYDRKKGIKVKTWIKTREDAKPEFLKLLFKDEGSDPPFTSIFKDEFPSLYKSLLSERDDLCWKLQQLESYLFVPLANQYASQGCLSVHDSLYFVDNVRDELLCSLNERFKASNLEKYKLN
jgi:hypothetical protein